jgi:hypothetical protein
MIMGRLDDLLAILEGRGSDTSATSCEQTEVSAKPAPVKACTPATPATSKNNDGGNDGRNTSQRASSMPFRWWRIHYHDREPVEVVYSPLATQAQILEWEPDAVKVEPFEPIRQKPDEPLPAEHEAQIRAWLNRIGEIDEDTIRDAIDQCH